MTPSRTPFFRAIRLAVFGHRRVDRACFRILGALRGAANGFLRVSLTSDELSGLTCAIYEAQPALDDPLQGLFPWEAAWYEASLPGPSAHLLVLAAGKGREVRALLLQGYQVDALEPVGEFWKRCRALDGVGEVIKASFSDLSAAVLEGVANEATSLASRSYDAVIVGWGGLNHVLADSERLALAQACSRLAPRGPILLSYYPRDAHDDEAHAISRSFRLGATAGRTCARLRGLPRRSASVGGFAWHVGLYATFADSDIEALADVLSRPCTIYPSEIYGHATIMAPNAGGPSGREAQRQ